MSEIKIRVVDDVDLPAFEHRAYQSFLQMMSNRRQVGHLRYERKGVGPEKRRKYMTRLEAEVKKYRETGNAEHLLNVANYAYLETREPEHNNHHFDNTAVSATRRKSDK